MAEYPQGNLQQRFYGITFHYTWLQSQHKAVLFLFKVRPMKQNRKHIN